MNPGVAYKNDTSGEVGGGGCCFKKEKKKQQKKTKKKLTILFDSCVYKILIAVGKGSFN